MKAEIIAVGTEILMGQIANTNATYLSQQLNELGFDLFHESVVGDNESRLLESLTLGEKRSDLIILTGGLGPTEDDLTKQTVAKFLALPLEEDAATRKKIQEYFQFSGKTLTKNNYLQALTIQGGIPLDNEAGLAVGTFITQGATSFLLLPGPPFELKTMFEKKVKPLLLKLFPLKHHLFSEVLRFYGIGESQLAARLEALIAEQENPTIATYAKPQEVTVRVTGSSEDLDEAKILVARTKEKILQVAGEFYYGSGEELSLEKVVVELLKERKATVTGAESLTGGLFQTTLTDVSGASEVFPGGFVTYLPEVKEQLLKVKKETIEKYGVVSEPVAKEMAEGARKKLGTDFALSFTGVAGPEKLEGHVPGTVWIGLAQKGEKPVAHLYHFNRDRWYIRHHAVKEGLDLLRRELLK